MNEEMRMVVNTIVDEMGRMEERINKRFDEVDKRFEKVDQRLDSMQHEINACKLDHETIELLIKRMDQHEKRIGALEKKTA